MALALLPRSVTFATYNGWITEANHHSDHQSGWFFMRHEIRADFARSTSTGSVVAFAPIAREFSMEWRITDSERRQRVVLMASRESHCPPTCCIAGTAASWIATFLA